MNGPACSTFDLYPDKRFYHSVLHYFPRKWSIISPNRGVPQLKIFFSSKQLFDFNVCVLNVYVR